MLQAIPANSTTSLVDGDIADNTTALPVKDNTTLTSSDLIDASATSNMTSNSTTLNTLTTNSTSKLLSTNSSLIQTPLNFTDTTLSNLTTTETAFTNATEMMSVNSTNSDPDVDFLVSQWTLGYRKQVDLGIENLSPKNVYKAYLKMKEVRHFKLFRDKG